MNTENQYNCNISYILKVKNIVQMTEAESMPAEREFNCLLKFIFYEISSKKNPKIIHHRMRSKHQWQQQTLCQTTKPILTPLGIIFIQLFVVISINECIVKLYCFKY